MRCSRIPHWSRSVTEIVAAVKKKLAELRIPIRAEDTGLNYGRTVEFYPETGDYIIKAVGKPPKKI